MKTRINPAIIILAILVFGILMHLWPIWTIIGSVLTGIIMCILIGGTEGEN